MKKRLNTRKAKVGKERGRERERERIRKREENVREEEASSVESPLHL